MFLEGAYFKTEFIPPLRGRGGVRWLVDGGVLSFAVVIANSIYDASGAQAAC